MKYLFSVLLIFLGFISYSADGYNYKFHIDGLADTSVYLANYFGGKMYYNDTAQVDGKGNFEFVGKGSKPGGIYAVVLPDKTSFFELVLVEPEFEISTSKSNLEGAIEIKGSPENKAFYSYKQFMMRKQKQLQDRKKSLESNPEADKAKLKAEIKDIESQLDNFRTGFIEKHAGKFVTKVLLATRDPEVPEAPALKDGSTDSTFAYRYFKNHYFDNVDMKDDRLLRSPVLSNRIEFFLKKLTPQIPDSICASARFMTDLTTEDSEIFKYIVQYTTTTYDKSKIMGMDAVFVCMAEHYYTQDKAYWMDSAKVADITERYNVLKNLVIGNKAENIILPDTAGKWQNLHEIDSKYTVLYFWDPNCGHCKKETPKLKKFFDEWKDKGVAVYAVCTEFETADWIKYVKSNDLNWTNVSDTPEINQAAWNYIGKQTTLNSLNFRDFWDLFSTPQLYLLDENKQIIGKRITAEQLPDFIEKIEAAKGS